MAVCMAPGCDVAFNLFHRRYRCRMCGKVFCSSCCSYEVVVAAPPTVMSPRHARQSSTSQSPFEVGSVAGMSMDGGQGDGEVACKVCRQCYYEAQLVISRRQPNGEVRRRCRGEFKLFQRVLLLNIFSFLTFQELSEVSRVSSDFYFISRDNIVWYQYNMRRWVQEEASPRLNTMSHTTEWQARQTQPNTNFQVAPLLQDAAMLSSSEVAKRTITLHARYNFTQFLDFSRRLEMAQRDGLSSFMLGIRILFSCAVKVAIVGPSHVGKTAAIRAFMGEKTSTMVVQPTVGFTRYSKRVSLGGAVRTDVMLHIFDISGADRYEQLRHFICRNCHTIGLCYDPTRKVTLVEAAAMIMTLEESLGPQPVVVCGLVPPKAQKGSSDAAASGGTEGAQEDTVPIEVQPSDAKSATVRGRRSLHCPVLETSLFFQDLLQCLLDRIALATIEKKNEHLDGEAPVEAAKEFANGWKKRPKADQHVARDLLNITMQPSPLDILLDA